jgi:hypothetical protein
MLDLWFRGFVGTKHDDFGGMECSSAASCQRGRQEDIQKKKKKKKKKKQKEEQA